MENKKTKLTLSGIAKKSIKNIELAKTQSKNSVVIEKKQSKYSSKSSLNKPFSRKPYRSHEKPFTPNKFSGFAKTAPITNDFEKRKLAEQRATRRLKGELPNKEPKLKICLLYTSPSPRD